ncbi:MFS general substrate transporter [Mycena pura]|uniref:MFS general substrate transporter n=1 Tax=Mycena pura TaxID=153505 RepID=A0AAD6YJ07_9AGAR|nr:MFS general substrate transporter [Mycena pura]
MEPASHIPPPPSTSTFIELGLDHKSELSSNNSEDAHNNVPLRPVDGGLGAWSFLAAAFVVETIVWGIPNAYGIFLDSYLQDPRYVSQQSATSLLPLIGTLSSGIIYCSGPVVNPIAARYPHHRRKSMWLGAALCCGTLFGASYATQIYQLILLQGVLYAIGGSLLYLPCISYLSEWFIARRGMANGILFAGTATGGVLFPLLLPPLIATRGLSQALRILSIVVGGFLFPLLPFVRARLPLTRVRVYKLAPRHGASGARDWVRNENFWILLTVNTVQGFAYFVPIIYLPTFANDLHISPSNAAVTLAMLNGASVVGRVSMGYLSDKFNPWILALTALSTASVATFILWGVLSRSFAGLLAFSIVYGSAAGGWTSLWTGFVRPLAKEDPAKLTTLYGFLLLSRGIGNIVSTPISTRLYAQLHAASGTAGSTPSTGFDVGGGRFKSMIIYVGTCFAGAAGVAALGWAMDAGKRGRRGQQDSVSAREAD